MSEQPVSIVAYTAVATFKGQGDSSALFWRRCRLAPARLLKKRSAHLRNPRLSTKTNRPLGVVLRTHARRVLVLLLSAACRSWMPFAFLGAFHRLMGRPLDSVFFCYPGDSRYAAYYSYPATRVLLRWMPSIIGVFEQGGRWALICASPVTEQEFTDTLHAPGLALLLRRLERVRRLVGARRISLAGILPSFLARAHSQYSGTFTDNTSEVVRQAVHSLRGDVQQLQAYKVVLLGGAGRIGRRVHELLRQDGVAVVAWDLTPDSAPVEHPIGDGPVLLVDVSRYRAINSYIDRLPSRSVVLNEVFPEPGPDVLRALRERNIAVFHIAGVKARVFPPLPHGYAKAVPCCAICALDAIEPVLRRLA
jgi:hypothetical protein